MPFKRIDSGHFRSRSPRRYSCSGGEHYSPSATCPFYSIKSDSSASSQGRDGVWFGSKARWNLDDRCKGLNVSQVFRRMRRNRSNLEKLESHEEQNRNHSPESENCPSHRSYARRFPYGRRSVRPRAGDHHVIRAVCYQASPISPQFKPKETPRGSYTLWVFVD